MAKVKIDGFIEELEAELKKALVSTLRKHFEENTYVDKAVFKTFRKEFIEKCNSWEQLPNKYIKNN